jgi:hypothetical protein
MSVYLNLALNGSVGTTTRQRLDGTEFRVSVLWLPYFTNVPFQTSPPPPLVIGDPGAWTFSLAQADGTVLIAGQILRTRVDVLAGFRGDSRFPGAGFGRILVWDTTGLDIEPGRDDLTLSSPRRLAYVPAAEA